MSTRAVQLVNDVQNIISMPEICFNVYNMANNPLCSAVEMAHAIGQDPGLSANVLKVANSPYYGFPARVDTIARAIAVIGTQDLRELVLATSVVGAFSELSEDVINLNHYWHHSLLTGLVSRRLGGKTTTPILRKERLFVAGLLHRLGLLVMAATNPRAYAKLRDMPSNHWKRIETEQALFGCTHTELGAELMATWHLPETLQEVTRYYPVPDQSNDFSLETSIVHLASQFVENELFIHASTVIDSVSDYAWQITGLDAVQLHESVGAAIVEYAEVASAFMLKSQAG